MVVVVVVDVDKCFNLSILLTVLIILLICKICLSDNYGCCFVLKFKFNCSSLLDLLQSRRVLREFCSLQGLMPQFARSAHFGINWY